MLADKDRFAMAEDMLTKSGQLAEFESANGPVQTRMMLTEGVPPEGAAIEVEDGDVVYKATFDDIDCAIGIVFDPVAHSPKSGMWVERQSPDALPPSEAAINVFAARIASSIMEDGIVKLPVISFIAENGHDLTLVGF